MSLPNFGAPTNAQQATWARALFAESQKQGSWTKKLSLEFQHERVAAIVKDLNEVSLEDETWVYVMCHSYEMDVVSFADAVSQLARKTALLLATERLTK